MPAIILLHGAIGAADQLQPLSDFFRQQGRDVHAFSFSGHGNTPYNSKGFGVDIFAEELHEFISRHHLEKPHVFGYSMGGYAALYLAHKQTGLLGNIATLATKFAWTPEIAAKEIKMLNAQAIKLKVPKFAEALQARHGKGWELLLQKTAEMMSGLGAQNLLNDEVISGIQNQVMLGLGDSDTMVSLDETLHVRTQLKNGSLYMLPSTKHPLESVDIKNLGTLLLSFLS